MKKFALFSLVALMSAGAAQEADAARSARGGRDVRAVEAKRVQDTAKKAQDSTARDMNRGMNDAEVNKIMQDLGNARNLARISPTAEANLRQIMGKDAEVRKAVEEIVRSEGNVEMVELSNVRLDALANLNLKSKTQAEIAAEAANPLLKERNDLAVEAYRKLALFDGAKNWEPEVRAKLTSMLVAINGRVSETSGLATPVFEVTQANSGGARLNDAEATQRMKDIKSLCK